jgi:hypothetical protein
LGATLVAEKCGAVWRLRRHTKHARNNTLLLHTTLLDFRTVALINLGYMRGDIVTWGVAVWGIRSYAQLECRARSDPDGLKLKSLYALYYAAPLRHPWFARSTATGEWLRGLAPVVGCGAHLLQCNGSNEASLLPAHTCRGWTSSRRCDCRRRWLHGRKLGSRRNAT